MEQPLRILLIEDDMDDVEFLEMSLKNKHVHYDLQLVTDGADAMKFIQTNNTLPHIIILDFNLPKVHGRELLKEFKHSAKYAEIPLMVLTTSSAKEDKDCASKLGASCYMIKPNTREGLDEIATMIIDLVKQ